MSTCAFHSIASTYGGRCIDCALEQAAELAIRRLQATMNDCVPEYVDPEKTARVDTLTSVEAAHGIQYRRTRS